MPTLGNGLSKLALTLLGTHTAVWVKFYHPAGLHFTGIKQNDEHFISPAFCVIMHSPMYRRVKLQQCKFQKNVTSDICIKFVFWIDLILTVPPYLSFHMYPDTTLRGLSADLDGCIFAWKNVDVCFECWLAPMKFKQAFFSRAFFDFFDYFSWHSTNSSCVEKISTSTWKKKPPA